MAKPMMSNVIGYDDNLKKILISSFLNKILQYLHHIPMLNQIYHQCQLLLNELCLLLLQQLSLFLVLIFCMDHTI